MVSSVMTYKSEPLLCNARINCCMVSSVAETPAWMHTSRLVDNLPPTGEDSSESKQQ
jgi:hypothetical protein